MLASASYNSGAVFIWDVQSGQQIRAMTGSGEQRGIAFSPDGKMLAAVGDSGIEFWDVGTGMLLKKIDANSGTFTFSPDGKVLVLSLWGGEIQYWSIPDVS